MQRLKVPNLHCGGCATAVTRAIREHMGAKAEVEVDVAAKEVRVSDSTDLQVVTFLLHGAGYPVERVLE
ncbi:heavy-metal-associated domain-containing protein [Jiella sp. M17.18]|uniref:heavy-metal-associated domain-containing protein n=1 Tax=Jiella sp. M17.18 TaxID=3234247 RepID=UPI0034DE8490